MEEHLTRRLLALDAAAVALALPLLAIASAAAGGRSIDALTVAIVAALFLLAEALPIDVEIREQGHTLAFTAVPLVIGLCTLPPATVLGLRLLTSLVVLGLIQRQGALKLVTNLASHALQVAVAAAILVPLVGSGPVEPTDWLVVVVAILTAEVAGTGVVTVAITLSEGEFDRSYLDGTLVGWALLVPDAALGLLAAILLDLQPGALVLLAVVGASLSVAARAAAAVAERYKVLAVLDSFTAALGVAVLEDRLHRTLLDELAQRMHADVAWIEDGTDPSARLVASKGSSVLDRAPLEAPSTGAAAHSDRIEGAVAGAGRPLRIGVESRLGEVRSFDGEDVRLFELLVAHAGIALQNVQLVDRLRDEARRNEVLATTDALTGLPNRTSFRRHLDGAGEAMAVLLVGLDRFKEVNETLGHGHGDELLEAVGRQLLAVVGEEARCARLGGDTFAVRLRAADQLGARQEAEQLLAALGGLHRLGGIDLDVAVTGGMACSEGDRADGERLLRQADVAMELAKRSRVPLEVYAADRDTANPARLAMAGRLRTAIEDEDLVLAYQPQIALDDGRVVGVESLVRWHPAGAPHPISPVEFVGVAERTGLIHPLTRLVLRRACEQAARWERAGLDLRVSVNLSARNLEDPTLVGDLAALIAQHRLSPSRLEVEVTETSVMADPEVAIASLRAIHDLGLAISIDDFGTGHSSLAYLTQLPVDQLKVDRSFVQALETSPQARAVVHAVVDLARHLQLEVVAEGVETEAHVEALAEMGCDLGQGYYYARPMAGEDVAAWARGRGRTSGAQVLALTAGHGR